MRQRLIPKYNFILDGLATGSTEIRMSFDTPRDAKAFRNNFYKYRKRVIANSGAHGDDCTTEEMYNRFIVATTVGVVQSGLELTFTCFGKPCKAEPKNISVTKP